jgi:FkbM family methyltransferase
MDIIEKFREVTREVKTPVVIELGGCDGYHTNIMCKVLSESHLYFIYHVLEPVDELSKSISRVMEWCKNVEVSTLAVSSKTGEMTLYKSDAKYYGSSSIRKPKRAFEFWSDMNFQESVCNAITLDDFVHSKQIDSRIIDWIWADVQGAEKDLIEGASKTLKNVRYFYTEFMEYEVYEGQVFDFQSLCDMLPDFEVVYRFEHDVLFKNKNL